MANWKSANSENLGEEKKYLIKILFNNKRKHWQDEHISGNEKDVNQLKSSEGKSGFYENAISFKDEKHCKLVSWLMLCYAS